MIIQGTNSLKYKAWQESQGITGKTNGAYHYALEIEKNILPHVGVDCFINTVGALLYSQKQIPDGAVIVVHDNHGTADKYRHLFKRGMVFICSKRIVMNELKRHGENAVFIPLSVDVEYVKRFKRKGKKKGTVFFGNSWGFKKRFMDGLAKKGNVEFITNMERDDCLKKLAKAEKVYAEGRCAIEAQVLGVEVELPRYETFQSELPPLVDNRDVIDEWAKALEMGIAYKKIKMNTDIYPYCKGDVVSLSPEKLASLERTATERKLVEAFVEV